MATLRLLTLEERKKLLHEYHWPASMFPNKKYKGNGTKRECDYYNIPIYSGVVQLSEETMLSIIEDGRRSYYLRRGSSHNPHSEDMARKCWFAGYHSAMYGVSKNAAYALILLEC
jgi:hypothetical protein